MLFNELRRDIELLLLGEGLLINLMDMGCWRCDDDVCLGIIDCIDGDINDNDCD